MQDAVTPGGTCYRLREGEGVNWVLLHGVGLDKQMWRRQERDLRASGSVLVYDLLGHGGGANPPGERTFADFIAQLDEVLRHAGLKKIALAGFSFGAMVALAFAASRPQQLTHLALLHCHYQRDADARRAVQRRYAQSQAEGVMVGFDAALGRWFSDEYRRTHPQVISALRQAVSAHPGDGYLKAYQLFAHAEKHLCDYSIMNITCPTLVITGDADPGATPALAKKLCDALPNARLAINRGQRHLAPIEHAATISAQLNAFATDA